MAAAPRAAHPTRTIAIIGGLIVLLVVAAVVAALATGAGQPASYPADSPEYAFQQYYQAFQDRDTQAAYSFLSQRVQGQLSYDQFAWYASQFQTPSDEGTIVRIDRAERGSGYAVLYLTVERFSGSGLNNSRWSEQRSVRLIEEAGGWKIDDPLVGLQIVLSPPK